MGALVIIKRMNLKLKMLNQNLHNFWQSKACIFKPATAFFMCFFIACFNQTSVAAQTKNAANELNSKYTELTTQLQNNQFNRPLYLNSIENPNDLKGEIYAVVDYPFNKVNAALNNPDHWCDALILHINVKYCHAASNKSERVLTMNIGNKVEQALADAYRIDLNYRNVSTASDYFAVELSAASGPLGTSDYLIWIEATPLNERQTFLHFTYAYAFGLASKLAMKTYLATIGRNKVGFTVNGKLSDGQPAYIKGIRGLVERNTMRYYLAIDSYIAESTSPHNEQLELRLQRWFSATEQYLPQLHEVEWVDYLAMKHMEYQRQQLGP